MTWPNAVLVKKTLILSLPYPCLVRVIIVNAYCNIVLQRISRHPVKGQVEKSIFEHMASLSLSFPLHLSLAYDPNCSRELCQSSQGQSWWFFVQVLPLLLVSSFGGLPVLGILVGWSWEPLLPAWIRRGSESSGTGSPKRLIAAVKTSCAPAAVSCL